MDLIRCDKCGCIRKPDVTKKINYTVSQDIPDIYGKVHWQGLDVNKTTTLDLCKDCWKEFVLKINNYFKQ